MPPKKSVQLSGVVVAQTELCSIDAERGILRYRGYDIADLAEHASYEEVAYLLLEGDLPDADDFAVFEEELAERELPRPVKAVIDGNAHDATPMEMLRTAVSQLSFYEPAEAAIDAANERRKAARLIAQLPTIVARPHSLRSGEEPIPPDPTLPYPEDFLAILRGRTRRHGPEGPARERPPLLGAAVPVPRHPGGPVHAALRVQPRRGAGGARARAAREQQDHPAGGRLRGAGAARVPDRGETVTLAEAAVQADELAQRGAERELAQLRAEWDDELEAAARSADFRERAAAYRAVGQFRYRQKLELLRRGLEDESPACRGSALVSLELLSREHPGVVNAVRPILHELAARDPNEAVRRLAVVALRNGSPQRDTILILRGLAESDEEEQELRAVAARIAAALKKRAGPR